MKTPSTPCSFWMMALPLGWSVTLGLRLWLNLLSAYTSVPSKMQGQSAPPSRSKSLQRR
jgi:hypothetical protein